MASAEQRVQSLHARERQLLKLMSRRSPPAASPPPWPSEARAALPLPNDQPAELAAELRELAAGQPEPASREISLRTRRLEEQLGSARRQWHEQWLVVVADHQLLCEELRGGQAVERERAGLAEDLTVACKTILALEDELDKAREQLGAERADCAALRSELQASEVARLDAEDMVQECEKAVLLLQGEGELQAELQAACDRWRTEAANQSANAKEAEARLGALEQLLARVRQQTADEVAAVKSQCEEQLVASRKDAMRRDASELMRRDTELQQGLEAKAAEVEAMSVEMKAKSNEVKSKSSEIEHLRKRVTELEAQARDGIAEAWKEAAEAQASGMQVQVALEEDLSQANQQLAELKKRVAKLQADRKRRPNPNPDRWSHGVRQGVFPAPRPEFEDLDFNSDGVIDRSEFIAAFTRKREAAKPTLEQQDLAPRRSSPTRHARQSVAPADATTQRLEARIASLEGRLSVAESELVSTQDELQRERSLVGSGTEDVEKDLPNPDKASSLRQLTANSKRVLDALNKETLMSRIHESHSRFDQAVSIQQSYKDSLID